LGNDFDPCLNLRKSRGTGLLRPYVVVFSTTTLDGRIADPSGYSRLSCDEDFVLLHRLRAMADAVMIGSNTVLADNPRLTLRLARGRSPIRIVVDSRLRIDPGSNVFSVPGKSILLTTIDHTEKELSRYKSRGIVIVQAGSGKVDLASGLEKLYTLGIRRLLVEGGGGLNCALLARRLVDEIHVTIAPRIFGAGISVFNGSGLGCPAHLAYIGHDVLCGGWVNLRYRVVYV